jgi:hypothetical protein
VADFLLLTKNAVRTEIFALRTQDSTGQSLWKFGRRVVLNRACGKHGGDQQTDHVRELRISKTEMGEKLGETRAAQSFDDNREYVDGNGQFINLTKMLQDINLPYLNLSNEIASKLGM